MSYLTTMLVEDHLMHALDARDAVKAKKRLFEGLLSNKLKASIVEYKKVTIGMK